MPQGGRTALHLSADGPCVSALVSSGCPLDARDGEGRTPLGVAAANGCEGAVRAMLAARADTEARDKARTDTLSSFFSLALQRKSLRCVDRVWYVYLLLSFRLCARRTG